jgi:hypothetical protein
MMNNMYDILAKMNLLEGRGSKPDFLDLDKDGNRSEPMKDAAKEVDESALQAYLGKKKYGKEGMKALQQAGREGASKERMASIRDRHDKMDEAEFGEGNEFSGARQAAIRAGKPTFSVDGKTYRVTGDTSDEKSMAEGRTEYDPVTGTTRHRGSYGTEYQGDDGDDDDYDQWGNRKPGAKKKAAVDPAAPKRGRGRPKGTGRAIGAKGPTGTSKLMREEDMEEAIGDPEGRGEREAQRRHLARDHKKLNDLERRALEKAKQTKLPAKKAMGEDYDKDEYDEEGEMAQSQARTIEDAAQELQSILDAQENLPEWVQKKISLAMDYIDTARDYLAANRPEDAMVAEKAVSKAQRAAAGIAHAAQKGDIPKSELRGASKEMAKMEPKELRKFAKTREKGLPEKVREVDMGQADARKTSPSSKEHNDKVFANARERSKKERAEHEAKQKEKSVEETTVAGSVAVSDAAPKGKKGMQFGKGVYESRLEEGFQASLDSVLNESMSMNVSTDDQGGKSLTITATDADAEKLSDILKLAGMQSSGYRDACPSCGGMHEGACKMSEDLANSPDPVSAELGDTGDYGVAGGVNGPKQQVNPNNAGDNPLAMRDLGRTAHTLSLGKVDESVEQRLWDIYKRYES